MALKFLNKKGWHTGSLRNLETVWKAEQKHEAEQKKLEELKAQLHKERESEEFRQQLHAAGLAPKQERLEFLYDSGLGVGGGASSSTKSLTAEESKGAPDASKKDDKRGQPAAEKPAPVAPGALFSDSNPQSANDKWRKIHSDPLFLIRQQELAARERIRKNPVKMQMLESQVRKTMEPEKRKSKAEGGSSSSRHHHKKRKKEKKERDKGEPQEKKSRREERTHHKKRKYDSEDDSSFERNDFPEKRVTNGISHRSHVKDSRGQNYEKDTNLRSRRDDTPERPERSRRSHSEDYSDKSYGKDSRLKSRRDDTPERPHRPRRNNSEDYSDQSYGKDSRLKSRGDDNPERPHRPHREDYSNQRYGKDSWLRSRRDDTPERPHRPHRGHSKDYSNQSDGKDSRLRSRRTDNSPQRPHRSYSPAINGGNTFAERRRRHDSPD